MFTQVLPVSNNSIETAAALLIEGAVVAFPTETVYGLGANGLSGDAVEAIFRAKGRPQDNPLILHVADSADVSMLVKSIPERAKQLMDAFWPGPLTIVLEAADIVPLQARGGLPTVAVRCPANEWARRLIGRCGFPLAAPSANLSGRPSPTNAADVLQDMDGRIALILDGGSCGIGLESTVVTLAGGVPRILRPGFVTAEDIAGICGEVYVDHAVLNELEQGAVAASPGMKYRHYSPDARLTVVGGSKEAVARHICRLYDEAVSKGLNPAVLAPGNSLPMYAKRAGYALGTGSAESAGEALFAVLRRLDLDGRTDVFAEALEPKGFGLAVMNRLLRAAGFHYIGVSD